MKERLNGKQNCVEYFFQTKPIHHRLHNSSSGCKTHLVKYFDQSNSGSIPIQTNLIKISIQFKIKLKALNNHHLMPHVVTRGQHNAEN